MSPFQEFRFWLRKSPGGERAIAGVGALLAVVMLAWLLVPGGDSSADLVSAGSDGGSAQATGANGAPTGSTDTTLAGTSGVVAGPSGGGGAATGGAAGTSGGTTGTTLAGQSAGGAACPTGTAKGVSGSTVKLAFGLTSIQGPVANGIFGIATPDEQKAGFQAVINGVNAEGGIGCKKIEPSFFEINPINQEELSQRCREISDSGVFAFLDSGSYTTYPAVECFGQRKLPYFGGYFANVDRLTRNFPYLFNLNLLDTTYRNAALVLKETGAFDPAKGFKKLGFVYRNCDGPLVNATKATLREVVGSFSDFTVGCPSILALESDLQQAILQFRRDGVTHVFTLGMLGDMSAFTRDAQGQGFKPKYTIADDGLISISYGSQAPDPQNFADAIAVTTNRGGEELTPGMAPTPGTQHCDKYYAAAKKPPTWKLPYAFGNMCNQVWMLRDAVANAGVWRQDLLAAGLQKAKSIDFSYPQGPTDFSGAKTTTGGQFYRIAQFYADCKCWKLTQRDFKGIRR
jgi:hypothetical protein